MIAPNPACPPDPPGRTDLTIAADIAAFVRETARDYPAGARLPPPYEERLFDLFQEVADALLFRDYPMSVKELKKLDPNRIRAVRYGLITAWKVCDAKARALTRAAVDADDEVEQAALTVTRYWTDIEPVLRYAELLLTVDPDDEAMRAVVEDVVSFADTVLAAYGKKYLRLNHRGLPPRGLWAGLTRKFVPDFTDEERRWADECVGPP